MDTRLVSEQLVFNFFCFFGVFDKSEKGISRKTLQKFHPTTFPPSSPR